MNFAIAFGYSYIFSSILLGISCIFLHTDENYATLRFYSSSKEVYISKRSIIYFALLRTFDSQIFVVTMSVLVSVRPVAVANDTDLTVHEDVGVSCVEKQHRQRKDRTDEPNNDRHTQSRLFSHTRFQRIHDGHVSETEF